MDGVSLRSANWAARRVTIAQMRSSLFDDAALFPCGTCTLDSALLMTNIAARWTADREIALDSASGAARYLPACTVNGREPNGKLLDVRAARAVLRLRLTGRMMSAS